jgi:hypothetical protein
MQVKRPSTSFGFSPTCASAVTLAWCASSMLV